MGRLKSWVTNTTSPHLCVAHPNPNPSSHPIPGYEMLSHIHSHSHICAHIFMHALFTFTHMHTHHSDACMHRMHNTHGTPHTHMQTHTCAHRCMHSCMLHTFTQNLCVCTHFHMHVHATHILHMCTFIHTHIHAGAHVPTHTFACTHPHTHMHTRAHPHSHLSTAESRTRVHRVDGQHQKQRERAHGIAAQSQSTDNLENIPTLRLVLSTGSPGSLVVLFTATCLCNV